MRFTGQGQNVVCQAGQAARTFGHSYVGSAHLLLALVTAPGTARRMLCYAGLEEEKVKRLTLLRYGTGTSGLPLPQSFSLQARGILQGAGREAAHFHTKKVDTEHILLSLLRRENNAAWEILRHCGVEAQVLQGDGFAPVEGRFDAIVTNPPIRAGKAVIYALFAAAKDYLKPGGALYIVIRKQQGAPSALKYLKEVYGRAEVVDRGSGFHVIRAEA